MAENIKEQDTQSFTVVHPKCLGYIHVELRQEELSALLKVYTLKTDHTLSLQNR